MEKHFILTEEFKINSDGVKLFRIQCTRKIPTVNIGDLGGFIEKEKNLSGNAWVEQDAEVYGNAWVSGNDWVSGNARVYGNAEVSGYTLVYGNARVFGNARIYGNAEVYGDAWVSGNAWVYGNARIYDNAEVFGNTEITGNAEISGSAHINGNLEINGEAEILHNRDFCCFQSFGSRGKTTSVFKEKGNKIKIIAGCFKGNIKEFEKAVEKTHGNNQFGKEYKAIVNVIKIKFNLN